MLSGKMGGAHVVTEGLVLSPELFLATSDGSIGEGSSLGLLVNNYYAGGFFMQMIYGHWQH